MSGLNAPAEALTATAGFVSSCREGAELVAGAVLEDDLEVACAQAGDALLQRAQRAERAGQDKWVAKNTAIIEASNRSSMRSWAARARWPNSQAKK